MYGTEGTESANKAPASDPALSLLVSVFLLLFGFFVMLNAISFANVRKTASALESLDSTFKAKRFALGRTEQITDGKTELAAVDRYEQDLRQTLMKELPGLDLEASRDGNRFRLELKATDMFPDGSSMVRLDRPELLIALAKVLGRKVADERRVAEFVFMNDGEALSLPGSPEQQLAVERAAALTEALRREGVAPQAIVAGVSPGDAAKIEIRFYSENPRESAVAEGGGA